MPFQIAKNSVVLFQGDSVTDAGRDRGDPDSLGTGYPYMIGAWFSARYPDMNVRFVNRGVSGDRVSDLRRRWTEDCVDLKPDVVSILIGINDCWRRYDSGDPTPVGDFERGYREILTRTVESLGNVRLVLCEPFVLPTPEDRVRWREDLDPKINAVRNLAREFDAVLVPLDGIFAQASMRREPEFWAADGVHPTPAGHALMAGAWLDAMKS